MLNVSPFRCHPSPKPTGAKLALKPVHVWGIRVRLQVSCKSRPQELNASVRNGWKADIALTEI